MKNWFQGLFIASLSVLAPIEGMIVSAIVMILADLLTGIMAAKKRGETINSAIMRRTISKFFVYNIAILTGYLLERYLVSDLLPVSKLVAGVIGLVEFKSILENCNTILGQNIFKTVLFWIGSENDSTKKDSDKKE